MVQVGGGGYREGRSTRGTGKWEISYTLLEAPSPRPPQHPLLCEVGFPSSPGDVGTRPQAWEV